jgi:hypothetical protein
MRLSSKWAVVLCAGMLGACNAPSFYREAGDMDTGSFGNAIMNNTLMATGAQSNPHSTGKYTGPVSHSGQISGKYAAQIMQTYHTEHSVRLHPSGQSSAAPSTP